MVPWVVQVLKVATIVILAGLVLVGGAKAFDYYRDQSTPSDVGRTYTITISADDDIDAVADKLTDAGLIQTDVYFKTRMRIESKSLEPGTYRLVKGVSVPEIIGAITSANSEARSEDNPTLTITVIEGWRTEQIADELGRLGLNGGAQAFMDAVRSYSGNNYDFLADRPDPSSLEGYLFPDTYNFKADTAPEDIIQLMLDNFESKITPELRQRASDMGLSLPQVLTFASLVEREAQLSEERPVIADVYLKRYEEGWRLEADPTVQYVLGTEADWWPELTGDDLFVDSPYNTYQNDGLPPAPIANPGYASIDAVLNPAETPYYFFVANPDESGSHLFAATSDAQAQNVAYADGEVDAPAPGSDPFASE